MLTEWQEDRQAACKTGIQIDKNDLHMNADKWISEQADRHEDGRTDGLRRRHNEGPKDTLYTSNAGNDTRHNSETSRH